MQILFTTSQKPMARLIRWATGEDCSHVAILITDSTCGDLVIHSNYKGVNMIPYSLFLEENQVVHSVTIDRDPRLLARVIEKKTGMPYDIGALLFDGIVLLCRRVLGLTKWPKLNLWQSTGMYLCTEFVSEFLYGEADSLITPCKLYERIK